VSKLTSKVAGVSSLTDETKQIVQQVPLTMLTLCSDMLVAWWHLKGTFRGWFP